MPEATVICSDSLGAMIGMKSRSVDLVLGSPPYPGKCSRYQAEPCPGFTDDSWLNTMLDYTTEACRVSRGWVIWVINSSVKEGLYEPFCEQLLVEAWKKNICVERPVVWEKNATPSRKGQWYSNKHEMCYAFSNMDSRPIFDWRQVAVPPRYKNGGRWQQRDANGARRRGGDYPSTDLALPGDVVYATVGGGHMGSKLAHGNEAPFPESLVEYLLLPNCPEGGTVLDPFCGSGTTLAVALKNNRNAIGFDFRESQCEITRQRLQEIENGLSVNGLGAES